MVRRVFASTKSKPCYSADGQTPGVRLELESRTAGRWCHRASGRTPRSSSWARSSWKTPTRVTLWPGSEEKPAKPIQLWWPPVPAPRAVDGCNKQLRAPEESGYEPDAVTFTMPSGAGKPKAILHVTLTAMLSLPK